MRNFFLQRKTHDFLILFILFFSSIINTGHTYQAVTYETSHGRFGDNLMSYFHAKWISYKHKIPLLYQPFIYSDQLSLHDIEEAFASFPKDGFYENITLGKKSFVNLSKEHSVLYFTPYFPESNWELNNCVGYDGAPWDYFEIDWKDKGFIRELRDCVSPKYFTPNISLPKDRFAIAVHYRHGGRYDDALTRKAFPLKFLPESFYISQIRRIYNMLNGKPLYVYIFSDHPYPSRILKKFKRELTDCDIMFDCRHASNSEHKNVLEDFFSLMEFDCLIHSESNFSFCASLVGDYLISIYPDSFHHTPNGIVLDHINISTKNIQTLEHNKK